MFLCFLALGFLLEISLCFYVFLFLCFCAFGLEFSFSLTYASIYRDTKTYVNTFYLNIESDFIKERILFIHRLVHQVLIKYSHCYGKFFLTYQFYIFWHLHYRFLSKTNLENVH